LRPLATLELERARRLRGLVFDLDDTFLEHGAIDRVAFDALFRMRSAGLHLFACTGRPALWAELALRWWPIDGAIAENGALFYLRAGERVERCDRLAIDVRLARRAELLAIAADLRTTHDGVALADDNAARLSDVTIDIGEYAKLSPEVVRDLEFRARARGARTFTSSVHLHLTFDADDKASGALRAIRRTIGLDATAARASFAYAGDSANDAAAFAAFDASIGVANVKKHVRALAVPPRFVTERPCSAGFCDIADLLVRARSAS
jgi:hydroxymethylpyrimidine pyrophosphatase-like HAD family hydrolase